MLGWSTSGVGELVGGAEIWRISAPLGIRLDDQPLLAPILSEATHATVAIDIANQTFSMPIRRKMQILIEADI